MKPDYDAIFFPFICWSECCSELCVKPSLRKKKKKTICFRDSWNTDVRSNTGISWCTSSLSSASWTSRAPNTTVDQQHLFFSLTLTVSGGGSERSGRKKEIMNSLIAKICIAGNFYFYFIHISINIQTSLFSFLDFKRIFFSFCHESKQSLFFQYDNGVTWDLVPNF